MSIIQIVIPHWGTPASLQEQIESLDQSFPLCIVNNASRLPPFQKQKGIRVINNLRNDGFARACNLGWRATDLPYVLFLNADCHISTTDIEMLLTEMLEKDWAAISPQFVDEQGTLQKDYHQPLPTVFSLLWQFSPLHRFPRIQTPLQTALPGGCVLVRREVLEAVNGWDERFWLWWEDVDFSRKLLTAEYQFGVSEQVEVEHKGGESFEPLPTVWKEQVFFHSLQIYARKHFSRFGQQSITLLTSRWAHSPLYPVDEDISVSIVVPNMRRERLEAFLAQNYELFDFEYQELIVVTSATYQDLVAKYPEVIFIGLAQNAGFASTVNVGFRRARGEIIGTINDDVELGEHWERALAGFTSGNIASVMPQVESPQGIVESFGVSVLPRGAAVPNVQEQTEAQTVNAAAVLFSRTALEKVGLFDERFGSYLEDVDLGLRMAEKGLTHRVLPGWKVVHLGQQTSQQWPLRKAWQDYKNWWLIVLKPYWWKNWLRAAPSILVERGRNLRGVLKSWHLSR